MDNETIKNLKEMINNLIVISKDKEIEIEDLKEKLRRERYIKRHTNKKMKALQFENMILNNKITDMIENNQDINNYDVVYNLVSFK